MQNVLPCTINEIFFKRICLIEIYYYYYNIVFVLKTHLKTYTYYKLKDIMLKCIDN